jgi:hypothetical protein
MYILSLDMGLFGVAGFCEVCDGGGDIAGVEENVDFGVAVMALVENTDSADGDRLFKTEGLEVYRVVATMLAVDESPSSTADGHTNPDRLVVYRVVATVLAVDEGPSSVSVGRMILSITSSGARGTFAR